MWEGERERERERGENQLDVCVLISSSKNPVSSGIRWMGKLGIEAACATTLGPL